MGQGGLPPMPFSERAWVADEPVETAVGVGQVVGVYLLLGTDQLLDGLVRPTH
jgi:hypothetical protein